MVLENNYNENLVNKHRMSMCMCRINISMLIRETFFYYLILIQANLQMPKIEQKKF